MDKYLTDLLGDRITDDWWERAIYGRDLAEVPAVLQRVLGLKPVPDMVARPTSTDEVAELVRYASERGLPVTPRGSGSSAFFNSVPARGGMTLDLTGLSSIEELDSSEGQVTVGAGIRWEQLDRELRRQGWAVRSCPTSAPAATVGGWLNMEGYGIGSLSYGPFGGQVTNLQVVLADGALKEISSQDTSPSISWFAGSDGTLGVVTRVTFAIRRAPEAEGHWLLSFGDVETLSRAARDLASETNRPYHLSYLSSTYFAFSNQMGFAVPEGEILEVAYEGTPAEVDLGKKAVEKVARHYGARMLDPEIALARWGERFYHMRFKRLGPTLLAAEDWLPLRSLGRYQTLVDSIGRRMGTRFYSYGTIVSPEMMTIFTGYRADARQGLQYLVAMAVTSRLHGVARRLGGHPYSIGLWNTPYLPSIFSAAELAELKRRKQQLDPRNLMNPGKHYSYPALLPPLVFSLGTSVVSALQRFTGPREQR